MATKQAPKRARAPFDMAEALKQLPAFHKQPSYIQSAQRRSELEQRIASFKSALQAAQGAEDEASRALDEAEFRAQAGRAKQSDVDAASKRFQAARRERAQLFYGLQDAERELAGLDAIAAEERGRLEALAQLLPAYGDALAAMTESLEAAALADADVAALAAALGNAGPGYFGMASHKREDYASQGEMEQAIAKQTMFERLNAAGRVMDLHMRELLPGSNSRITLWLDGADAERAAIEQRIAAVRARLAEMDAQDAAHAA